MDFHDVSLIAFTILMQMAVGSFIVSRIVHFFATRKAGLEQADRMGGLALLVIGPIMGLGLIASFGHLGNPTNAPNAISNLATSWLSREILFVLLFSGLGALFAVMQWRKIGSASLRNMVAWLAALVGLGLVWSMSHVYMLASQPAWNTLATPISFFTSTFLLGSLAIGVTYAVNLSLVKRSDPDCVEAQCILLRGSLRWISFVSVALLGVVVVTTPLHLAYLAGGDPAAQASAALLFSNFGVLQGLRLGLVFLGAGVLGLFLYQNAGSPGREAMLGNLTYAAFAMVFVAEVMGRYLFYASQMRIGV
jgi:anaerobic dimethyl sulfoxide reductase subunit C